ncbi:MAG: hypothetical protein R3F59_33610 [Myxococcota bacterium]
MTGLQSVSAPQPGGHRPAHRRADRRPRPDPRGGRSSAAPRTSSKDEVSPQLDLEHDPPTYARWFCRTPSPAQPVDPLQGACSSSSRPTLTLQPGSVIDRYEVLERIGIGGMALVYRVRHRALHSEHALVLRSTPAADPRRLMLEGRAQACLRHPNLVMATDVPELRGGIGLVMEYGSTPPRSRSGLEHRQPQVDDWPELFRCIVRGVRHAHQQGWSTAT